MGYDEPWVLKERQQSFISDDKPQSSTRQMSPDYPALLLYAEFRVEFSTDKLNLNELKYSPSSVY